MSDDVRWNDLTHQQIYDMVWAGPGHLASAEAQSMWRSVAPRLDTIVGDLRAVTTPLRVDWEGSAAEAVDRNLRQLEGSLDQAVRGAERTADSLDRQAEHVATLRNTLPPPPPPDPLSDYPGIEFGPDAGVAAGLLVDQQQLDAQRAELAQQAVQAMETYTTNSARNKAHMYAFASPLPVTNDAASATSFSPSGLGSGAVGGFGGGLPNPVTAPPAALPPLPGSPDVLPIGQPGGGFGGGAGISGGSGGGGIGAGAGGAGGGVAVPFAPGAGVIGGTGSGTTPPSGRGAAGVRPGLTPSTGNRQAPSFRVPPPGTVGGGRGSFPGLPGSGGGPGLSEPGGVPRSTSGVLPSGTGAGSGSGTTSGARPAGNHGFFPPGGGAGGGQSREHRRPPYLIDDTDAFGDDRYFTPQVITPDDYIPRRT